MCFLKKGTKCIVQLLPVAMGFTFVFCLSLSLHHASAGAFTRRNVGLVSHLAWFGSAFRTSSSKPFSPHAQLCGPDTDTHRFTDQHLHLLSSLTQPPFFPFLGAERKEKRKKSKLESGQVTNFPYFMKVPMILPPGVEEDVFRPPERHTHLSYKSH